MEKTLRDEFAMAAMQGDWAVHNEYGGTYFRTNPKGDFSASAEVYYRMADAMMKARETKGDE